jgi:hypothetical protein
MRPAANWSKYDKRDLRGRFQSKPDKDKIAIIDAPRNNQPKFEATYLYSQWAVPLGHFTRIL